WLARCRIVRRHFNNQLLHVGRHTWTATGSRFPFPKHSEPAAVLANQCVGLDDREGVPPVEETREMGKRKTNGVGSAPRLDLSLNVEAELFAEEQILGGNSSLEQTLIRQKPTVRTTASKYSIKRLEDEY